MSTDHDKSVNSSAKGFARMRRFPNMDFHRALLGRGYRLGPPGATLAANGHVEYRLAVAITAFL